MFDNKKANNNIEVLGAILLVIVVVYAIINIATTRLKDASDSFGDLLNTYTANCDADGDGLNTSLDLCPCDHDDFFATRTYRFAEVPCNVGRMCSSDVSKIGDNDKLITKLSTCTGQNQGEELPVGFEAWSYYVELRQPSCKLTPDSGNLKVGSEEVCAGKEVTIGGNPRFVFGNECALKVLALRVDTKEPSFMCKTSTKECKKMLNERC